MYIYYNEDLRGNINPAENVEEYLALLPGPLKDTLQQLRKTIRDAAPGAHELIRFNMPAYDLNGRLVLFAAFKNHCGLYVVNPALLEKFREELAPYKLAKATIQFTVDNPLPKELVTRIVKERVKDNAGAFLPKK